MVSLALLGVLATPPRYTIPLNTGWEFCRMPPAPSVWQYLDAVPTAAWKVLRVSSEEATGENGKAANAIDGDVNTHWHTEWSKTQAPFPHEIVIDLGGKTQAAGVRLLPRQDGPRNACPGAFDVYLADRADAWGSATASFAAKRTWSPQEFKFGKTVSGRYLRLVFKSGQVADPFLALGEIGLIAPKPTVTGADWQAQYNVAWVEVGDARFDLKGAQLESVKKKELAVLRQKPWTPVTLPHSSNDELLGANDPWRGVCYYRQTLAPFGDPQQLATLTFGAGMQVSDVWVNDKWVGGRRGGYLPISIDLTPFNSKRQKMSILVRLDNEDNPLVPPGKPYRQLDFTYQGGLYRDAYLTLTNPVHITDPLVENKQASGGIFVTFPKVAEDESTVEVRTHWRNSGSMAVGVTVLQELKDQDGKVVATAEKSGKLNGGQDAQEVQTLTVTRPHLWSPNSPDLYTLTTRLRQGTEVIDEVTTKVGIRSFKLTRRDGLLVNGKPLRLVGTNRHQEYPWVGNALSREANYRDFYKIKQAGFNMVRLSHYPQDPAVLEACDELGIFVIDCIPGWQFMNSDERFRSAVRQDIRDMIRRDRNHPSVLLWETSLNETYPSTEIANEWHTTAHEEFIGENFFTAGDGHKGAKWDLPYNGWNDQTKDRPQDADPNKPGYIREYGDYEFGGGRSTTRMFRGQGEAALLQAAWNYVWSHNKNRAKYPWTFGDGNWLMFDYNRGYDPRPESSGISDINRIPRFNFYFFQSQLDANAPWSKPMVYAANWWTSRPSPTKVVVFSNCDEVELRVNGKVISRQKPDAGADTPYGDYQNGGNPFDGGNGKHLAHPPFTFNGVTFEAGKLEAVGFIGGKEAARHEVLTPGKPAALRLRLDTSGKDLKAGGSDLVFVYADVVDANGTIIPDSSAPVTYVVSGEGRLVGPKSPLAEAGIATSLVKSSLRAGKVLIRVSSPGLKGAELEIRTVDEN